jgi:thiamine kinase-like enzyme
MTNLNSGLSGCKIELIDNHTIKKFSSGENYNKRLLQQCDKQMFFSKKTLKAVQVPKVFNVRKEDLYSFEMEYVTGQSFDQFFSFCGIDDVNFVIESLIEYFDCIFESAKMYSSEESKIKILKKLESLEEKTKYQDLISWLKCLIEIEDLSMPKSFCHGDLTFTNVIFSGKRIYLIDFLDSYLDTPLIDLVKLKQDLFYYWSLEIQQLDNLRIRQSYNKIWTTIKDVYRNYIDTTSFDVLDLINTLRIEPYLTNDYQRSILNSIIKRSEIYENFNCSYGGTI